VTRPTLFASDLHLSPARPDLLRAFVAMTRGPAREADALYLLGDVFDSWIGDDQLREPLASDVAHALAALTASGVGVHLMRGNRYFLMGERLARASGARLLPDEIVIDLHGRPTLLLHGDELCTADVSYQRFRAWSRNARRQRRFVALPYALRRAIARMLRGGSGRATAMKADAITDVTDDAVIDAFRRHGVDRMIHGHTHRPARHHLLIDGRECERWVLADWHDHASGLVMTSAGGEVREWSALD